MGLLDGKVVLVTGAGGGIGRCHALACAAEGAKVVVNDLGGARDGTGAGNAMADKVVSEIEAAGGEALANYDSVTDYEGCERMVQGALDKWGRLDAIVNNAGILRDKSFAKMSEQEWDLVMAVHVTGSRNVTKAALEALRASGAGRIINTTSYSGMIGNFGQSNYAAAKAGIYGFTRVMALEQRKYGVTANAVAPVAKTRMTDDIDMVPDEFRPEQISPIVVYLASDLAQNITGQVFGVQGQRIHLYEVKTNDGIEKDTDDLWTASEIHEHIDGIMKWEQPAAADGDDDDVVTKVFSFFPAGFNKGSGWDAVLHWVVEGGTDQTIEVSKDAVNVKAGLHGSPTCTVKLSKDTLVAMFTGELDATKAFMTGKASADNMGDLMKLGTAFDFKKVAAAYAAAGDADKDVVSEVFAYFPKGFKAGAAPGWTANIQWVVDGGTDQTIKIVDGDSCEVAQGLDGTATTTVKVDKDTLVAMFSGELDATKAFMTGKASADNMGDLMKLGMAFDFKAIAAAYKADHDAPAEAPAAKEEAAAPADPTSFVGKRYDAGHYQVIDAEGEAYAKATDDNNDAYFGDDAIVPPMYHVKPMIELMMRMAGDPQLKMDILRLVHGEHEMRFNSALKHGDVIQLRGELLDVAQKSSGTVYKFGMYGFVDGQLALDGWTSYFIRAKKKPGDAPKKKAPPAEPTEVPEPTAMITQSVTDDQALRYAEASGDDNPIHVDENTAKAAGLPRTILHGLCTMAFAQRDLVDNFCDGDPRKLAFLGVRFAKPVFPGETLTLKVWDQGEGKLAFITENGDGKVVISNGRAEVR